MFIAKKITKICFYIFAVIAFLGCSDKVSDNITKISKGMSEAEVLELLGVPDKARTVERAMTLGPLGTEKYFMYKGNNKWYRIIIGGGGKVLYKCETVDDKENPQFRIKMEIKILGNGEYEYKIGGDV